jgi:hypothetical protein
MALPGTRRWALTDTPTRNHGLVDLLQLLRIIGFQYQVYLHEPWSSTYNRLGMVRLIYSTRLPDKVSLQSTILPLDQQEKDRYHKLFLIFKEIQAQAQGQVQDQAQDLTQQSYDLNKIQRKFCAFATSKFEWLQNLIAVNSYSTLLIISSFPAALQRIQDIIPDAVHIDQLQSLTNLEHKAVLISYSGFSAHKRFDLTLFDTVVLWDPWYSSEHVERILTALTTSSLDRQPKCYQLLCADTIELRIATIANQKRNSARAILDRASGQHA